MPGLHWMLIVTTPGAPPLHLAPKLKRALYPGARATRPSSWYHPPQTLLRRLVTTGAEQKWQYRHEGLRYCGCVACWRHAANRGPRDVLPVRLETWPNSHRARHRARQQWSLDERTITVSTRDFSAPPTPKMIHQRAYWEDCDFCFQVVLGLREFLFLSVDQIRCILL